MKMKFHSKTNQIILIHNSFSTEYLLLCVRLLDQMPSLMIPIPSEYLSIDVAAKQMNNLESDSI